MGFCGPIRDMRYQTNAITSPPTPRSAAWRFVMTPTEVDMMAVPSPPRTRGRRSLPRVDAAAGLRDALEVGDDAAAVARELQLDDEHAVRERLPLSSVASTTRKSLM